jgi:hypothetical protein
MGVVLGTIEAFIAPFPGVTFEVDDFRFTWLFWRRLLQFDGSWSRSRQW